MAAAATKLNCVRQHRLAMGQSQDSLAKAAGISRAGLSAIEGHRLMPSVSTALALARALGTTVELLFDGPLAHSEPRWAAEPARYPMRYWAADVAGQTILYPLEAVRGSCVRHDGVAQRAAIDDVARDASSETLVIATCDPAASYLAQEYSRHTPFRMLVLPRTSREALALLDRGLVHVAGIHLAEAGEGNRQAVAACGLQTDIQLLAVAKWDEGIAYSPAKRLRTARQAVAADLRWIGRRAGAGARRCQNEIFGTRLPPRHTANDHFDVVSAIRCGFVDAGVCVRLVAEEAQLPFLAVCEEDYDLCIPRSQADDPRIAALVDVLRSPAYRGLLAELPGYRLRRSDKGAIVAGTQHGVGSKT